ncbi:MAG: DUF2905 domain-containing protein [Chloroflexota bacterium]|nr:DUF2905 domain-containing protein [Dehalococcoidia bacterium]MDW8047267.1 DUF2905 domain-containing protein [Chloroflexota bacterium]
MDGRSFGLLLMVAGLAIAVAGGLVWLGAFSWFGRLPGDLRFGNEHVRVYIPLTTMVVLSVVMTILLSLLSRLR